MAEFILSAFSDEAGGGILDQIAALKRNGLTHTEPRGLDHGNISEYTAENADEKNAAANTEQKTFNSKNLYTA
jgi:hypothetical protein